jgi:enoyl-CoA hydratase/carnithine racemase
MLKAHSLKFVIYQKKDGIGYVTLNRPDVLNALNARMLEELVSVWEDVREDGNVQVVIMTGAGEAFMQGRGDIKGLAGRLNAEPAPPTRPFRYSWNTPASPKAHYVFKPVIVAVNGVCATSGLEQVSEADIVICSDNATFFDNHVSYASIVHSAVALSKRIPYNHVLRMSLMGSHEVLDARRAYEIGLVTEVTSRERLMPRATEIAKTIMLNSPTAVQASLEILWHSLSMGLRDAMQLDSYMQRYYHNHPDFAEANKAAVEGRTPVWKDAYWHHGH